MNRVAAPGEAPRGRASRRRAAAEREALAAVVRPSPVARSGCCPSWPGSPAGWPLSGRWPGRLEQAARQAGSSGRRRPAAGPGPPPPGDRGPPTRLWRPARRPARVRLVLVAGKGGVGKTTWAAAAALALGQTPPRRRVLLLSTDPAHSLGDVLMATVGDDERHVPGARPASGSGSSTPTGPSPTCERATRPPWTRCSIPVRGDSWLDLDLRSGRRPRPPRPGPRRSGRAVRAPGCDRSPRSRRGAARRRGMTWSWSTPHPPGTRCGSWPCPGWPSSGSEPAGHAPRVPPGPRPGRPGHRPGRRCSRAPAAPGAARPTRAQARAVVVTRAAALPRLETGAS